MSTPLFWAITQRVMESPYRRFGTKYRSHLQGSAIKKALDSWLLKLVQILCPASCTVDTGSFPGLESGRGVKLTAHPLLVLWSWKIKAIPLLPLWAVRPVQSLSACTRVHFSFTDTLSRNVVRNYYYLVRNSLDERSSERGDWFEPVLNMPTPLSLSLTLNFLLAPLKTQYPKNLILRQENIKPMKEIIIRITIDRTQLLYVVLIYLSEWLNVSALIRPSSGHKYII